MKDLLNLLIILPFILVLISSRVKGARLTPETDDMYFYFETIDYHKIYYQKFSPDQEPRGIVIFIPEIGGGAKNDYQIFGNMLSAHGYQVLLLHQRGTGYSDGTRGDVQEFEYILEDYEDLILKARKSYPDLPIFLAGHGLGAAISLKLALDFQVKLRGLILINIGIEFPNTSNSSLLSSLIRAFSRIFWPGALTVEVVNRPVKIQNQKDREEVSARLIDPLVVKKFSVRYTDEAEKIVQDSLSNAEKATHPVLMIQGEEDVYSSGSGQIFVKWRGTDKTYLLIKGAGHGAYITDESWRDVLNWLDARFDS